MINVSAHGFCHSPTPLNLRSYAVTQSCALESYDAD